MLIVTISSPQLSTRTHILIVKLLIVEITISYLQWVTGIKKPSLYKKRNFTFAQNQLKNGAYDFFLFSFSFPPFFSEKTSTFGRHHTLRYETPSDYNK